MRATCNICGGAVDISYPTGTKVCKWCAMAHNLVLPAALTDEKVVLAPESRIYALDRDLTYAGVTGNPTTDAEWRAEWTQFCKDIFHENVDLSGIRIPPNLGGYDWVLFLLPWMTQNRLWDKCTVLFTGHSQFGDDLDKSVPTHERDVANGAYAVRVRPNVEADEEFKNRSARWIAEQKLTTMTLPERLILEPWYHWKTGGKHLDIQTITLCAGSRFSDGFVPRVDWHDGELRVRWRSPDYANVGLRARSVIV